MGADDNQEQTGKGTHPLKREKSVEPASVDDKSLIEDDEIIELSEQLPGASEDDEIIELTDTISAAAVEIDESFEISDETLKIDMEFDDTLEKELSDVRSIEGDIASSLGIDLEPGDIAGDLSDIDSKQKVETGRKDENEPDRLEQISIPKKQIEESIERVIKEMLSEKLENILVEVIEKAVTKEIEWFKSVLLEDLKIDSK